MLVTCRQMQEMEERAFASGLLAADLMEQAGIGIARVVQQFFPQPGTVVLYLGSGNNAGDALVAGRELQKEGWQVMARFSGDPDQLKPLPLAHWQALRDVSRLESATGIPAQGPLVLLDGLLGIGSRGPLRPHLLALAQEMNHLRETRGASTIAMDIPSGLDGDTGEPYEGCVIADVTVTVAAAKKGLVADAAIHQVGRLALVPLPDLAAFAPEDAEADAATLLTPDNLRPWLPRRAFDFHKGQAGRVGILAGSKGFFGAAELVCRGALRAAAGLITLIVKPDAYDILASRVPPEVMVKPVQDYREVLDMRFDALGIGPGLGFDHEAESLEVIARASCPAVIDADALTALARQGDHFLAHSAPRLLTPHPGEMSRLAPDNGSLPRRVQAETWAQTHHGHTLLLKGSRTVIATHRQPVLLNTTGHPGMATGGMGDVLTGVCAALIGQGISLHQAAGLGAWLCGRSAEIHAAWQSPESTLPSDVIANLGTAWRELATGSGF